MSERICNYCRAKGFNCVTPYVVGNPDSRIVCAENGRQGILMEPIDKCAAKIAVEKTLIQLSAPIYSPTTDYANKVLV